ncbi:hypothetical protein AQUCO_01300142v1 [Aquilegia coerulea]|uniref:HMG box domain-containing protein n=1 Tax=Aquilegia coerulea TaxID=218851 RepID=A0A2G5DZX8_AQUCA|nr:hypothetical protein AQUCO_01300142v1 [Aquilegia coerulea]
MAEIVSNLPLEANLVPIPKNKRGKSRKALKPKDSTSNEANILAGKISSSPQSDLLDVSGKENQDALSLTSKRNKRGSKIVKESKNSFENELEEIQKKLEQMRIEKEKTEELLKDRDEMLKMKEEELENRGKEQEKLQMELKKLQKAKEFKPTMSFPLVQSLREKEEDKKGKKKKQEKLKKPCAAYVLWCKDQWNEVKKENPDAEFKEISNILGTKWKNLSDEEKKPYEQKYQEDKEAYLQIVGKEKRENEAMSLLEEDQKQKVAMELLDQYLQFKQEADEAIKKKAKKEKDPSKPKQSLSAYFLYMKERRVALVEENQNVTEIAKITGEEWKNMSEKQRKPYEEIAKKQKEEYTKEMELYKQKKEDEAAARQQEEGELMKIQKQEAMQLLKKKEKTDNIIKKTKEKRQLNKKQKQVNVDPNKPKRPASSFLLFSKEMRKNLLLEKPDINSSTLTALISVKWKELDENEKEIWNTKAANAMNAYKKELQEYNNATEEVVEINE